MSFDPRSRRPFADESDPLERPAPGRATRTQRLARGTPAPAEGAAPASTAAIDAGALSEQHQVQERGLAAAMGFAAPPPTVQRHAAVGQVGDAYEQHADAVAARVVAGESAEDLLGGAQRAAPTVQRAPGKGAPKDDWAPTRPDNPEKFTRPHVDITPDVTDVTVELGDSHHQHFKVSDKHIPPGTELTWNHKATGQAPAKELDVLSDQVQHGPSAEFWFAPKMAGVRPVTTHLTYGAVGHRDGEDVAKIRYHTPGPSNPAIVKLDSKSARGQLPVTQEYQVGEELIVTMHQDHTDGMLADEHVHATFDGVRPTQTRALGKGVFEVHLPAATQAGRRTGNLRVMPFETRAEDAAPLLIDLAVAKMANEHDFGGDDKHQGRPNGYADALKHLEREIDGVFAARQAAVGTLLLQHAEKDPPPETPLWKTLLLEAGKIALNMVTAGLGAHFAGKIMEHFDKASWEGTKEVIKVFSEESMNLALNTGYELATRNTPGEGGEAKEDATPQLGLRASFHKMQSESLRAMHTATAGSTVTNMGSKAAAAEARETGAGTRMIMQLTDDFASMAKEAHDKQYLASFQALTTMMAHSALGFADKAAMDAKGGEKAAKDGLDLSSQVGLNNAVSHEEQQPDPLITSTRTVRALGMQKTAGILRLTLKAVGPIGAEGGLAIDEAQLEGYDNDAIANSIAGVPLSELTMPVVARYSADADTGFMIGRNESGTYFGNFSAGLAEKVVKSGDPLEAARHVFVTSLGGAAPKKVKRG